MMGQLRSLPLVGRAHELETLAEALRAYAGGKATAPSLITVGGEAGVGKSRLVREAQAALGDAPVRWVQARCIPHGGSSPWHPLRDLLSELSGVDPAQRTDLKLRLIDLFAHQEQLEAEALDAAKHLLSLPTEDASWPDLPAPERRRRLFGGLRSVIAALAREQRTVLVLEDLHWIDPVTLEWLDAALTGDFAAQTGLLIIAAHRTSFRHLWPAGAQRVDIGLEPLGAADSEALLAEVFGLHGTLPDPLRALLLERTGGNPFFLEEAVRLLIDRGDLVEDGEGRVHFAHEGVAIDLPATPQGLVEERVHRLERRLRHLLQCAAVIGTEVHPQVLAHLAEVETTLDSPLDALVEEQMLDRREALRGLALLFRHSITHEVTYATLLRRQRAHLHGRLGQYLEELHRDHLDEASELLAFHFGVSDLPDKAVLYLRRAADQAVRLCAHESAEAHLSRLAEVLREHPLTIAGAAEKSVHVALERGRLARLRGDFAQACALFAEALALTDQARSKAPEPPRWCDLLAVEIHRAWGEAERQRGQTAVSLRQTGEALAICERLTAQSPDDEDAARELMGCQLALGTAERTSGNPSRALDLLARAEKMARQLGDLTSLARAKNNTGIAHLSLGHPREALHSFESATDLWRESGDRRNLVSALNNMGIALERLVELDRALTIYSEALRLAHEIGHHRAILANHINVGQLLQWLDNQPEAMRHFRTVVERTERQPDDVAMALALINLAWSHIWRSEPAHAAPLLESADAIAASTGDHSVLVHSRLLRARLALNEGQAAAAREAALDAAERLIHAGGGDEMPTALRLLAEAEATLGNAREAHRQLRAAASAASKVGDPRETVLIHLAEAGLARAEGRAGPHHRALRRAGKALQRHPVPLLSRLLAEAELES